MTGDASLDLWLVVALHPRGMRTRRLFGIPIPSLRRARGALHADVTRTGARIRGGGRGFSLPGRMVIFSRADGIGRGPLAVESKRCAQDIAVAMPSPGYQPAQRPINRHPFERSRPVRRGAHSGCHRAGCQRAWILRRGSGTRPDRGVERRRRKVESYPPGDSARRSSERGPAANFAVNAGERTRPRVRCPASRRTSVSHLCSAAGCANCLRRAAEDCTRGRVRSPAERASFRSVSSSRSSAPSEAPWPRLIDPRCR